MLAPMRILVVEDEPKMADVRVAGDGIRFYSQPEAVEPLTTRLGGLGVGIRQLELPRTALETLFFRLTETDTAEPAAETA